MLQFSINTFWIHSQSMNKYACPGRTRVTKASSRTLQPFAGCLSLHPRNFRGDLLESSEAVHKACQESLQFAARAH